MLYTDDNDQLLVNNSSTADTRTYRQSWVNNIENWTTSDENTKPAYVLSGKLAIVREQQPGIYKCPSDRTVADNGPRLRNISMNSLVGNPLHTPNRFNPTWLQFLKPRTSPARPTSTSSWKNTRTRSMTGISGIARMRSVGGTCPPRGTTAQPTCPRPTAMLNATAGCRIRCVPLVRGGVGSGGFAPSPATDYLWLRERTSIKPATEAPNRVNR